MVYLLGTSASRRRLPSYGAVTKCLIRNRHRRTRMPKVKKKLNLYRFHHPLQASLCELRPNKSLETQSAQRRAYCRYTVRSKAPELCGGFQKSFFGIDESSRCKKINAFFFLRFELSNVFERTVFLYFSVFFVPRTSPLQLQGRVGGELLLWPPSPQL